MQIEVSVKALKDEIDARMKENRLGHEKAVNLYLEKLAKYAEYVRICAARKVYLRKSAPPVPRMVDEVHKGVLRALNAHEGTTVKLTDEEYNNMLRGVETQHERIEEEIAALMALSY